MRILIFFAIPLVPLTAWWLVVQAGQKRQKFLNYSDEWKVGEQQIKGRGLGIFLMPPHGGEPELFGEPVSNRLTEWEYEEELVARRLGAAQRVAANNRRLTS